MLNNDFYKEIRESPLSVRSILSLYFLSISYDDKKVIESLSEENAKIYLFALSQKIFCEKQIENLIMETETFIKKEKSCKIQKK